VLKRAWTFQEGALSSILIFFGRHRVTVVDRQHWDTEPIDIVDERPSKHRQIKGDRRLSAELNRVLAGTSLGAILETYSVRQLGKQHDKLDAIRGLLRDQGVFSYWGTPLGYSAADVADSAQSRSAIKCIAQWLSWRPKKFDRKPISMLWPSWSWLAGTSVAFDNPPADWKKSTHLGYSICIALTSVKFEGFDGVLMSTADMFKAYPHRAMLAEIDRFIHVRGPVYTVRLKSFSTNRHLSRADLDCQPLNGESYKAQVFADRLWWTPTTQRSVPFVALVVGLWHTLERAVHIAAIILEPRADGYRRFGHLKIVLRAPRLAESSSKKMRQNSKHRFYRSREDYKAQMKRVARLMSLDEQTVRIG
jgi:hypothetical protein